MLRILANYTHYALAVNNLTFVAHFLYRRPNFHLFHLVLLTTRDSRPQTYLYRYVILPRFRS